MRINRYGGSDAAAEQPSPEAIREQLQRVLANAAFEAGERRRTFLRFVVDETLAGRAGRLKGITIALAVFERDETFDQQSDPVVRLEARRLRRDLDSYYSTAGRDDPIRISIPKGGYAPRFDWQARPAPEQAAPLGTTAPSAAGGASAHGAPNASSRRPIPRPYWLTAAVVFLILASVAAVQFLRLSPEQGAPFSGLDDDVLAMPSGPAVAVFPFVNLSSDAEKHYFAAGITEQLSTELARFRHLRVLWLGTSERYQTGLVNAQTLHRVNAQSLRSELGADYGLEGSVRTSGEIVRITARLIDATDAHQVWVRSFEEPLHPDRIYEIQDAIAQEVASNVAGKYGAVAQSSMQRAKRKAPASLNAFDCVLRYYDYQRTISEPQHAKVQACLERAIETEPDFAEAWAVLANVYMQHKRYGYCHRAACEAFVAKARDLVTHAIALDPYDSTGHMVLSNLLFTEGDIAGFKAAGERALHLNPNDTNLLTHYGMRLAFIGEWERGLALVRKAIAMNPVHPGWYYFPQALYDYSRREYDRALAESDKINMPGFFWSHLMRAATLGQLGRLDEANDAADKVLALRPDFRHEAQSLMQIWQFPQPLLRDLVDGLQKSGL